MDSRPLFVFLVFLYLLQEASTTHLLAYPEFGDVFNFSSLTENVVDDLSEYGTIVSPGKVQNRRKSLTWKQYLICDTLASDGRQTSPSVARLPCR